MKAYQSIGCRQITFAGLPGKVEELVVNLSYAGDAGVFKGVALDNLIPEIVHRFNAFDQLNAELAKRQATKETRT